MKSLSSLERDGRLFGFFLSDDPWPQMARPSSGRPNLGLSIQKTSNVFLTAFDKVFVKLWTRLSTYSSKFVYKLIIEAKTADFKGF